MSSFVPVAAVFSLTALLWASAAVGLYALAWIVYARHLHPLRHVPGPWLASVSRLWYIIQIARGDMEYTQRRLHAQHGPLIRIAPNEVACAAPDAIKTIYGTHAALDKTDFYTVWNSHHFSKYPDLFTAIDDKTHGDRRRIVNHVYSLSNVLRSEEFIDRCSDLFVARLAQYQDGTTPLDLGKWLQMYAFDVIGELYFGRMFGFLDAQRDHGAWIQSLDLLMPFLCMTAVAPTYLRPLILASALVVPGSIRALKAIDKIGDVAKTSVAAKFAAPATSEAGQRTDMLEQLHAIHRNKGDKVDFHMGEIVQEAFVALFAGSDTTAIALRSVFYHLIKHPAVYRQVVREIDQAAAAGRLSTPVQYAEALQLPWLCASIKEAMRVHPSVALTMARVAPAGGLVLGGVYIPAGYRVGMNAAVVHFDRSVFGPDADEYRPARWMEGDAAAMDKHLLHFGAGSRTCIGKNISLAELHKLVPYVLRKFDVKMWEPDQTWTTRNLWFNKQAGLQVQLKARPLVP